MFEKEAKDYIEKHSEYDETFDMHLVTCSSEKVFKDAAEFGYNKANIWHYTSKGEYPEENKRYLCKIKAFVGSGITYECLDYDTEYNSWKDACGDVIAWKEIVPPKESE